MPDTHFHLGYTHVCYTYQDGFRVRHEQDPPLGGIRLDKHQAQLLVDGLIRDGVVRAPLSDREKLDSLQKKHERDVHRVERHDEEIALFMRFNIFTHSVAVDIVKSAAELFGNEVRVKYVFPTLEVTAEPEAVAVAVEVDRVRVLAIAEECHRQLVGSGWYDGYEINDEGVWVVYAKPHTKENLAIQMVGLWLKALGHETIPFKLLFRPERFEPMPIQPEPLLVASACAQTIQNAFGHADWYNGYSLNANGLTIHVTGVATNYVRTEIGKVLRSIGHPELAYEVQCKSPPLELTTTTTQGG